MTLDAPLAALVEIGGFAPVHRGGVLLHPLAAPLGEGWRPHGRQVSRRVRHKTHGKKKQRDSPTYGVASLHLIDRRLGGGKPGVPSAVAELDEQPLVGRATEMAFAEVTAVSSRRELLVLGHKQRVLFFFNLSYCHKIDGRSCRMNQNICIQQQRFSSPALFPPPAPGRRRSVRPIG